VEEEPLHHEAVHSSSEGVEAEEVRRMKVVAVVEEHYQPSGVHMQNDLVTGEEVSMTNLEEVEEVEEHSGPHFVVVEEVHILHFEEGVQVVHLFRHGVLEQEEL
jgi:hypothetical protein